MIDLTEAEETRDPNFADLKTFLSNTHPRKLNGEEYSFLETYHFETGSHSCIHGGSSNRSEIDRYGVAVTLYFRFIK